MKIQRAYLLVAIVTCMFLSERAHGGHLLDVSISYTHITGNQYLVTARQYRDCMGLPAMNTLAVCLYSNTNAFQTTLYLPKISAVALPPSPFLPPGVSTCSGGNAFGMEKVIYSDTITVPFAASDWVFGSYLEDFITFTTNRNFFGGTTMDNLNYPGNSSPSFVYDPLFLHCVGTPSWENYYAMDADGDSLLYSIAPLMYDTLICPNEPYSDTTNSWMNSMNLIPIYMDPDSGWITFTMNQLGVAAITIMVEEIRNGIAIGTTKQIQYFYHVSGCINLGEPDFTEDFSINVYPSPAGNEVFLQWKNHSPSGTIICTALDGKEVLRTEISAGQQIFRIDASDFPSGIYALRFFGNTGTNGNANVQSLRFVKM